MVKALQAAAEMRRMAQDLENIFTNLIQSLLPNFMRGKNTLSGCGEYCSVLTKSYALSVYQAAALFGCVSSHTLNIIMELFNYYTAISFLLVLPTNSIFVLILQKLNIEF